MKKSCSGNSRVISSGSRVFISHKYQLGNLHVCSWISFCNGCLLSCQYLGNVEGSWRERRGWERAVQRGGETSNKSYWARQDGQANPRVCYCSFCKQWSRTLLCTVFFLLSPAHVLLLPSSVSPPSNHFSSLITVELLTSLCWWVFCQEKETER